MKKILVLTLTLALSLSLCACGNSKTADTAEAEEATVVDAEVTEAVVEAVAEEDKMEAEAVDPESSTKGDGVSTEKAVTEDSDKGYSGWTAAEWTNTFSYGCTACVGLINNSSVTICEIYISPVSSNYWGDDVLGSILLYPDEEYFADLDYNRNNLTFDVRVVDINGRGYDWKVNVGNLDYWDMTFELYGNKGNLELWCY